MDKANRDALTRRERQIIDALYRLGRGTVGQVMEELSTASNYSTVRAQLNVLEAKGHVRHEEQGLRYVYSPTTPRHTVRQSELKRLVDTFFDGSMEKVVAALLGGERHTREELERIEKLIAKAKKEGRK